MGRIRADKCNTVHDRTRLSGAVPSTLYAALWSALSVGRHYFCFLFNKCGTAQLFAIYLYL